MKKLIILLVSLLTISLNSFAPSITYKTITLGIETLQEIQEIQEKLKKLERLRIIQKVDSSTMRILNKYKRNKTTNQHNLFINKIKLIADSLDIHYSWLVGIMHHESRLNSKALNSIKAVGLIQFLPSTAKGLGTTTNKLYNMSDIKQLDYVYKFYKYGKGKFKTSTDLYLYAFFPIAVLNNWPDTKVITYGKLTANIIAKHNKGLDTNKDGKITVGEFRKEVLKKTPFEMLS